MVWSEPRYPFANSGTGNELHDWPALLAAAVFEELANVTFIVPHSVVANSAFAAQVVEECGEMDLKVHTAGHTCARCPIATPRFGLSFIASGSETDSEALCRSHFGIAEH